MDDVKVEKIFMEDGRSAEKFITDDGETRVVELHVEEARPKHLAKRIVEKRKPIVYEREIQTLNEAGEVVDRVVETIDPENTMVPVADTVTKADLNEAVAALSVVKEPKVHMQSFMDQKMESSGVSKQDMIWWAVVVVQFAAMAYLIWK